jgi:BirA family biotin operon repressor/biotin-[acetyl-CoA-carboxylase] ligase
MSLLLFPPPALRRAALLVAWVAVSVCELVHDIAGLPATIKWPNDVLVDGKKICGILIEQRNSGDPNLPLATVVGLGLNVTQPADAFAAADLPDAGSLFSLSNRSLDIDAVADRLVCRLDEEYERLLHGDTASLESRWMQRLGLVGRRVRIVGVDLEQQGRLLNVSLEGIELEVSPGMVVRLAPEAVRGMVAA